LVTSIPASFGSFVFDFFLFLKAAALIRKLAEFRKWASGRNGVPFDIQAVYAFKYLFS